MPRALVLLLAAAGLLTACSPAQTTTPQATGSSASPTPSASQGSVGSLTASGFGQEDKYVWVTAIVRNNTQQVGQTVTVNFNVLDASGTILKSEAQVESFSQPGVDHILGTQVQLEAGEKAARVEATLLVEFNGTFSSTPFPAMPVTTPVVKKDEYGGRVVSFELTNPQQVPISDPRIGIACVDSSGAIIGGGVTFPQLVPAGGRIKVDATVILSGEPSSCSVFTGAPSSWGTSAPSVSAAPTGSAASAFETWVNQFSAQDWAGQYTTLVSAQQALISKDRYTSCRTSGEVMSMKWIGVISSQDVAADPIPGTTKSLPATLVKVSVQVSGLAVPVDAHMYNEKGTWKWAMTQQNLTGCGVI